MGQLMVVVGLMLATVLLVGVGDRLRVPWPVLMTMLAAGLAFIPGIPEVHIDAELILPLFLPPLLWALARRTSVAMFRARWRVIVVHAVLLVLLTTAAVAGAGWLLVSGMSVSAAVALGAMTAPPDPVAVEAVAGPVRMPHRMLELLQTEGLFNDAVALVAFQAALAATVGGAHTPVGVHLLEFGYAAVVAVLLGLAGGWLAGLLLPRIVDVAGRSGLTLVVPFAVYLAAEEVHASGVIAVVIAALVVGGKESADEAAQRLTGSAFWEVIELLITGVAFGLIGLELRGVADNAGARLGVMVLHGLVVAGVVVGVRLLWMLFSWARLRRRGGEDIAPRTVAEAVVLGWSGMRGLVTLALALSLPEHGVPARTEIVVIASIVLLGTLVLPGLTLPWLVRVLGVAEEADAANAAERVLVLRAKRAALGVVREAQERGEIPPEVTGWLAAQYKDLDADNQDEDYQLRVAELKKRLTQSGSLRAAAMAAAQREVLSARGERGVDPAAADRVLRRLDIRLLATTRQ